MPHAAGEHEARPSDPVDPAAALPMDTRTGIAPVAITDRDEAAALVADSLPLAIRRLALPAVASSLLMTTFASADAYWVGTRIGGAGLAAVSISLFWIWMIVAIAEMVGIGLTAVAARRHGERRPEAAAHATSDAVLLALLLGVIVGALGTIYLDELFGAMRAPPEVTALGRDYLAIYLLGAPLIFGFFAVDAAFRASGDTRTPLALLIVSVSIALVMDPVLMLGLWGVPSFGIAGAAIATIVTRSAVFVMGLVLLHRRGMVRWRRPHAATLRAICRVGLPTAATGAFFSIIYVLLTRTTTQFGTPALAALGVGHRVESWIYMIAVGFGAATAAVVGQNIGAGRLDRAARAGWISVGYAMIPGGFVCALMLLIPETLASIFSDDPAVIAETANYLRIAAVAQVVLAFEVVLEGALGGAGHTVPPMIASTTFTALRIPLAAWAAMEWGVSGLWWVLTATAIARAAAMGVIWGRGGWKRARI